MSRTLSNPVVPSARRPRRATAWGLFAEATHGPLTAELDDGLNGRGWLLRLATPGWTLPLNVDGPEVIAQAARLLQSPHGKLPAIPLGLWNRSPAELIRDDEFDDRAFLIVGRPRPMRITFAGETFASLTAVMAALARRVGADG